MIIDSSSLGLATCDGHTFVYCGTSRAIPTHSTLVGVRGNYIYGAFTGASSARASTLRGWRAAGSR